MVVGTSGFSPNNVWYTKQQKGRVQNFGLVPLILDARDGPPPGGFRHFELVVLVLLPRKYYGSMLVGVVDTSTLVGHTSYQITYPTKHVERETCAWRGAR